MTQHWQGGDAPVITPGGLQPTYDSQRSGACHVIEIDGHYRLYYWGTDAHGHHSILCAETPVDAPNDWRPRGGPLLQRQPDVELNANGPSFPFVLPVTETRWLMYVGCWGHRADGRLPNTTAAAISDDAGETWRYHDVAPLLPLDRPYDCEGTGSVWVLLEDGLFRMYYTAIGTYSSAPDGVATGHGTTVPRIGIGYAESTDGLTWHKPLDDLMVSPRGFGVEPWEYIVSKPCVVREPDGSYTLWLNTFGTAYRVHRLHSPDGRAWTWGDRVGPDGELGTGAPGSFDDHQRSYPTIIRHGDRYRCWYTGNRFGLTGIGYLEQDA